jgi:small subunit ribosomal protein S9
MAVKKVEKTEKVVKPKAVKPKAEKVVKVVKVAKEVKVEKIEKEVKVEKVEKVVKPVAKKAAGKYFYAVGRRKTSVAQVRLFENDKAQDTDIIINDKKMNDYFPTISLQNNLLQPLKAVGMHGKFTMTVLVRGGGVTGQVEATRLGISRALVEFDANFKKTLKDLGLMTRDAREVERKKAGLKKARKAPQWAKR